MSAAGSDPSPRQDQPDRPIGRLTFLNPMGTSHACARGRTPRGHRGSAPKVTSARLHPQRTRHRWCPSRSCPGRLQEGKWLMGGEWNPFPAGLPSKIAGFGAVPSTRLGPQEQTPSHRKGTPSSRPRRGPAIGKVPPAMPPAAQRGGGQRFASPAALVFTPSRARQEHQLPAPVREHRSGPQCWSGTPSPKTHLNFLQPVA